MKRHPTLSLRSHDPLAKGVSECCPITENEKKFPLYRGKKGSKKRSRNQGEKQGNMMTNFLTGQI